MVDPIDSNAATNPESTPEINNKSSNWKTPNLRRYVVFVGILAVVLAALGFFMLTNKQDEEVYTIGVLRLTTTLNIVEEGFYQGMEDLGYEEGKNVRYIVSDFGHIPPAMQGLAQGLIDQDVDLIMAITNTAAEGAKRATIESGRTDIPIVYTHASGPDKTGLIESFKSSGNHLTGVAINFEEVTEKRLEFLLRIQPGIKKLGIIDDSITGDPPVKAAKSQVEAAAPKFGMEIVSFPVYSAEEDEATEEVAAITSSMQPEDIDALYYIPGQIMSFPSVPRLVYDMSDRLKIPGACLVPQQVQEGCLFSYAPDAPAMGAQAAVFVDKILRRGQHPSDIPTEFASKHILSINLKTARESGFVLPESMLLLADITIDE